jgi:hypothetical protein
MSIIVNLSAILIGIGLIIIVVKLMVERKIIESEAILWILIGLVLVIMGIIPGIIPIIAEIFGVWYPPTILFAVAIVGLILIVFKNTVTISKQMKEINELSMQISLMNLELKKMKQADQEKS